MYMEVTSTFTSNADNEIQNQSFSSIVPSMIPRYFSMLGKIMFFCIIFVIIKKNKDDIKEINIYC